MRIRAIPRGQVMSDDVNPEEIDRDMKVDWTIDPISGYSNSSPEFLELKKEVGRLIRDSAHDIVRGQADAVGGLIMAQLAHVHGLAPASVKVHTATADEPGNLHGYFEWNGQFFRFDAVPVNLPTPDQEVNHT